ncbi:hypothetical protein JCM3770_004503 [Rhodotorula araucariae]
MFWRSIPRAVDVLARPDADNYPHTPPRAARPPRPNAARRTDSASTDRDDQDAHAGPGSTSLPPLRAGAMRRAVHAVMAEERRRAPERMSDVVEAAMEQQRSEKELRKGGLTGMLRKRKSVVDLFRKNSGREEGSVDTREKTAADQSCTRYSPTTGEQDEAAATARSSAGSLAVSGYGQPSRPLSEASVTPYGPAAARPAPSRSSTSAHPPGLSVPRRPPSPLRRTTMAALEEPPSFVPRARECALPIARAGSRSRSWLAGTDPYEQVLQQNFYVPRRHLGVDDDESDGSSVISTSSRRSVGSFSDVGSSDRAAPPSTASFDLPRTCTTPPGPLTEPVTAYRSPKSPSSQLATPYTGLVNLGNTCYLACVLQALAATEPVAEFFANDDYLQEINTTSRFGLKGQLAKAFARLVRAMRGGEYRSVSPAQLRETIGRLSKQYLEPTQQDAHELLLVLLDGLHEDLNLVDEPPAPQREVELERLPEVVAADQEWEKYRARNDSVVIDFFQGQLRNRMECMHCHQTSTTFSPMQTLSLSIPTPRAPGLVVTLSQCIDEFLREEILHGDNAWNCPSCHTLRSTSKRFSIARLPQTLIIHLKRFTPLATKLTTRVALPLAPLPLGHLLPPFALDPPRDYALNAPHQRETTYELYAACCHLGEDGSGHYTTLLRQPAAPSSNTAAPPPPPPAFVLLDDETVDPLSTPGAHAAALRTAEETAYLLFFRLVRGSGSS